MKKFCVFLALVLSFAFVGVMLVQDKPVVMPDKPVAAEVAKPVAEPAKSKIDKGTLLG